MLQARNEIDTERGAGAVVEFTPFTAGGLEDPYPVYKQLRDDFPLYRTSEHDLWVISRHKDVCAVSRDWKRFSNARGVDTDHTGEPLGANFLDSDPPDHDVLRRVLQKSFNPKLIRVTLEAKIRAQASELIGRLLEARSGADFAHDYAWPLPISVTAMVLGLPNGDLDYLRSLSETFVRRDPGRVDPPAQSRQAAASLCDYLQDVIEARRKRPRDDVISSLVEARVDGARLSPDALLGNCALLYVAGTETTSSLLTNLAVLLATFPDERRWLVQHPHALDQAVEELLRFDAPLAHLCRNTTETVELLGERLPAGARVVLLYGSANRDPRHFEDPDRLRLSREPRRHLAFGDGIHHCLGAPLARLEGRVTLQVLLERSPEFQLTQAPTRLASHLLRGYSRVRLSFDPK
jgi:cytochrome P450